MALSANLGATIVIDNDRDAKDDGAGLAAMLFGEDQGRYLVTAPKGATDIERLCEGAGLDCVWIGNTGDKDLTVTSWEPDHTLAQIPLTALREASDSFFRDWMES